MGDIVSATGVLEPGTFTFRVFNLEVLEAWKFSHAGISFVPKLLPSLQKGFEHTIAPGDPLQLAVDKWFVQSNYTNCNLQ